MLDFKISPVLKAISTDFLANLQKKIDTKTKPVGALGKLEKLALKISCIQNTLTPTLNNPTMIVFAGDHGIAAEGVSLFEPEVTRQMIYNFLNGGAGINVFTRQNGMKIKIVDSGVNYDFDFATETTNFINAKIAKGTKNYLYEPAMTIEQCNEAILKGAEITRSVQKDGCNIIGFGEMGIGNTSSASLILSLLCKIPVKKCVGRGTGLNDERLAKKISILEKAVQNNKIDGSPLSILATFGGFEIAMMTGAMLQAAELGMILMIDGFLATSALLVAAKMHQEILDYCIFAHKSDESAHALMLEHLKADPILDLGLRLGEGTGVAVAYPIINSAVMFLNEMASLEEAHVSNKEFLSSGPNCN